MFRPEYIRWQNVVLLFSKMCKYIIWMFLMLSIILKFARDLISVDMVPDYQAEIRSWHIDWHIDFKCVSDMVHDCTIHLVSLNFRRWCDIV